MISRREVIKWGAAAPAFAACSHAAFASGVQGCDAFLLDQRFAAQVPQNHWGIPVMRFDGDVTGHWYQTIDPAWRQRGYVLGGITGSDALFVLETLAQQHGRRVVSRSQVGAADARGIAPVSWIIAPVHPSVVA
ncbi:hypothetical protein GCM10009127_09260 [Alteraurantiacibacter aestuarii]|uniref:Uncharacterized protein n=1 Tax=Alteraurantiacibacter aestuarii TaxID=650004 RepID=A0A844ZIC0_9SPHN|nr:hypothetical protein [Alteraurantiacibacter aestuarii]MXO87314.1 hypothetical protein [Alteraurantiacibacter aestuarii]